MKSSVIISGSIAIDHIETPQEKKENLLGGSAAYAALAASFLGNQVDLVSVLGKDFPSIYLDFFKSKNIQVDAINYTSLPTFTWSGKYSDNMNERVTLEVDTQSLDQWQPNLPVSLRKKHYWALANLNPSKQLNLLEQIDHSETYVIADTMDLWIDVARENLLKLLTKIDALVLNDQEAQLLADTSQFSQAGSKLLEMGPKTIIIKHGEHGASLIHQTQPSPKWFRCPGFPLPKVVDPTGAGDSFLGGFIGHLAAKESINPSFSDLKEALVEGIVLSSFTCEDFSVDALCRLADNPAIYNQRKAQLIELTSH